MREEREELVKQVFPQLRKLCESRGVTWGEVDLRWGVTDEQQAEGKVLPVCLAEIRQCRPYFLGILGERYGWVPEELSGEVLEREPWLAQQAGRSVTELEILQGVLNDPEMAEHAFFYFRDPVYLESLPSRERPRYREQSEARGAQLGALKVRIRESGFPVRENYRDPKELGRLVTEDFIGVIDRLFPEGSAPDPLDREGAVHEAFARNRRAVYIGRGVYFDRLDAHAAGEGPPLVLVGQSGGGKSALLAAWTDHYRQRHPDAVLLTHFIGATADSTDWVTTVRRLLGELNRLRGLGIEIPSEPAALRGAFALGLRECGAVGKTILVLDALNQLEDREGGLDLEWIPRDIPPGVRLVVSALPGVALDALHDRCWPRLEVEPLEVAERERLIVRYLAQYGKQLAPDRIALLASPPQTANPLYLRALLEELRLWGDHETLDARLRHFLAAATPAELYDRILARLEEDYEDDRPGLVGDAMRHLWAARRGLSTAELLELLGTGTAPLPGAYWSPFHLAVESALVNRSGLLGFSHEHVRGAVEARYVGTTEARRGAHLRLVAYFQTQAIGPRLVEELPWQAAAAEEWDGLKTLLSFEPFLAAAWETDPGKLDVRRFWTRLEATGRRIEDGYRLIIAQPLQHPWTAVIVRELLAGVGRVDQALALDRELLDFYRSDQFQQLVDRRLGRAAPEEFQGTSDLLSLAQPLMVADRLQSMAHGHLQQGQFDEALDLLGQAEAVLREIEYPRALARCLELQADVHLAAKDLNAAERRYERSEALYRAHGEGADVAGVQSSRSRLLHARGRTGEALELAREVERERRARGDRQGLATVHSDIGHLYHDLGDSARAIEAFEAAAGIHRELGDWRGVANNLNSHAVVLEGRGEGTAAHELLTEAERISRETGDRRTLAISLLNQAQGLSQSSAGREQASAKCAEAIGLFTELGDRATALQAKGVLGQIKVGYRKRWQGWVVLVLFGLLAGAAVAAGSRRWWWWLLGGPLALAWLQAAAFQVIPRYRAATMRVVQQLSAELRKMDHEERRRTPPG